MDFLNDTAFACYVMEQEGVFDCRSRQEKIEAVIQEVVELNPVFNDPKLIEEFCVHNHLTDLNPHEVVYIINEINYRKGV